ncbi:MAG: hypothetical protein Q8S53_01470 [Brevundimonas sp.]|uniref:hypothetical protein n=1 Tax=Brevundimonas sp. TaxID=1871086 RepID=UPI002735999D|nr:hypothetical protein [Brevundimonas sp.]MDP3377006.1 hypothetical protein [Brevundimonas sp.]
MANSVSVATFIAATFQWLGFNLAPQFSPSTVGVANLILVVFSACATFGLLSYLRMKKDREEPSLLIGIMATIAYAFTLTTLAAFLVGRLPEQFDFIWTVALTCALAYGVVLAFGHAFPLVYPNGFNFIDFMFWVWRPSRYPAYFTAFYYIIAPWLLMIAFGAPPETLRGD